MANVVYMGKVIWERSYGKMNRSNPSAPNLSSKTVFPVASVTKVFTVSASVLPGIRLETLMHEIRTIIS